MGCLTEYLQSVGVTPPVETTKVVPKLIKGGVYRSHSSRRDYVLVSWATWYSHIRGVYTGKIVYRQYGFSSPHTCNLGEWLEDFELVQAPDFSSLC